MLVNYKPFVERMISVYEGPYGWDRADSGGPTKYGITCYDLAAHRHQKMDSMARWASIVRAMTLQEADDIYAAKYAVQCHFNDLHSGSDCVVFDFGVNSGSSRSVKYAQMVVGAHVDGILGDETLAKINGHNAAAFINALCDARLRFLRGLRIWGTFGRGWSSRVKDLRAYSLRLLEQEQLGIAAVPAKAEKPTLVASRAKEQRIPTAFGKAYGTEELRDLKQQHAA